LCKRSHQLFFHDCPYSFQTDVGKTRKKNEDALGCYIPQDPQVFHEYGAIFIVADGVGGSLHGDIASRLAVKTIIHKYYKAPVSSSIRDRLITSIQTANELILTESTMNHESNMATTVVVAVVCKKMIYFANVGDSRAYISGPHRVGGMEQITTDHTLIEEQIKKGLILRKHILEADCQNIITNCLGFEKSVHVDSFEVPILDQDKILLTSDGLTHVANDNQILDVLNQASCEFNSKGLVDLANSLGGPDNISVYVIEANSLQKLPPIKKQSYKTPFVTVSFFLFIAIFLCCLFSLLFI
jgi:protein phosphatase